MKHDSLMSFLNNSLLKSSGQRSSVRLRIGLTQRLETNLEYSERRDSLDLRWYELLECTGAILIPVPNGLIDLDKWLYSQKINAVIFTGGGDLNVEFIKSNSYHPPRNRTDSETAREITELKLYYYCLRSNFPMMGICRGAQFLNAVAGGTLSRVYGHTSTSHSISCSNSAEFSEYTELFPNMVNSFHNYGIKVVDLANTSIPLAIAGDTIEAFISPLHRSFGIMWHPERDDDTRNANANSELFMSHFCH